MMFRNARVRARVSAKREERKRREGNCRGNPLKQIRREAEEEPECQHGSGMSRRDQNIGAYATMTGGVVGWVWRSGQSIGCLLRISYGICHRLLVSERARKNRSDDPRRRRKTDGIGVPDPRWMPSPAVGRALWRDGLWPLTPSQPEDPVSSRLPRPSSYRPLRAPSSLINRESALPLPDPAAVLAHSYQSHPRLAHPPPPRPWTKQSSQARSRTLFLTPVLFVGLALFQFISSDRLPVRLGGSPLLTGLAHSSDGQRPCCPSPFVSSFPLLRAPDVCGAWAWPPTGLAPRFPLLPRSLCLLARSRVYFPRYGKRSCLSSLWESPFLAGVRPRRASERTKPREDA